MNAEDTAINTLLAGNMLTSDEVAYLVCDYEYETELDNEPDRWTTSAYTIIEVEGRYFGLSWRRGNTEMQENYYDPQYAVEVEPYEETIIVKSWRPIQK